MSGFSVASRSSYELGTTSDMARRSRAAANKGFVGEGRFEFMSPNAAPAAKAAVGQLGNGAFGPGGRQTDLGSFSSALSSQFGVDSQMLVTSPSSPQDGKGCGLSLGASNPFNEKTLTGLTASGSRVEVVPGENGTVSVRIRSFNGGEMTFDLSENAKLNEQKDGSVLVTLLDSNQRYLIRPDGTMEETMQTADNSGDDIYINIDGKMVNAGSGDDLIFNFASHATILGGTGDDWVLLGDELTDLFIDTGEGDDTITGKSVSNSVITTGPGDDTVMIDYVSKDTTIDLGGGNNVAKIRSMGGTLKAGNGDNTFDIGQALEDALCLVGSGKNTYLGNGGAYFSRMNK